jgi:hypothetical protein
LRDVQVQRAPARPGPYTTVATLAPSAAGTYSDADVEADHDDWYRLSLVSAAGTEYTSASVHVRVTSGTTLPTRLLPPFEPADGGPVSLRYSIARPLTPVELTVYNSRGQCLWSAGKTLRDSGDYTVLWDRRDRSGVECPRGVYFVRMRAGAAIFSTKLTLLRR